MNRLAHNITIFTLGFGACAAFVRMATVTQPPAMPAFRVASLSSEGLGAGSGPRGQSGADIAEIVDRVGDSVVSINAYDAPARLADTPGDLLERQFGLKSTRDSADSPRGVASGVIYRPDGYIVTNNHVVEDATRLRVRLADGRVYDAKVVGSDPYSDLAVIRIKAGNLTPAYVGGSKGLRRGDPVLAIGNPLGFENSVSSGVVSAVRQGAFRVENRVLSDVIQTDAAINQGNSGGGLFNRQGELAGINTAIVSTPSSGGSIGIGFAIPMDRARPVFDSLIRAGRVPRPWIGIRYRGLDAGLPMALADEFVGVMVEDVLPNSPAAKAGLQEGDVIRGLGAQAIRRQDDVHEFVGKHSPGELVTVTLMRGGEAMQVRMRLTEPPARG